MPMNKDRMYVYSLSYPNEGVFTGLGVFYYAHGKGDAMHQHENNMHKRQATPKNEVIRTIHAMGYKVVKQVIGRVYAEEDAIRWVRVLVETAREEGHPLANSTTGGRGVPKKRAAVMREQPGLVRDYDRAKLQSIIRKLMHLPDNAQPDPYWFQEVGFVSLDEIEDEKAERANERGYTPDHFRSDEISSSSARLWGESDLT